VNFKDTYKAVAKSWVVYLFMLPAFFSMSLVILYPLVKGIYFSFTDIDQYNMGNIFKDPSYVWVGLKNYIDILFDPDSDLLPVLWQTMVWTVANVFCHFTLGLTFAILINRNFKGRGFYRLVLMIPWAVPAYVAAFSWRWMYNSEYGVFNAVLTWFGLEPVNWLSDPFWAMFAAISTNVWIGYPFMMVSLLAGLKAIPSNLYEAAMIDGSSKVHQFFHITLPMLKPVAFSVTLLGFVWTFNMFPIIYLVTRGGPSGSTEILATYAYREAFENWNLASASTYGVIILSILIVLSGVYSKATKYTG
jgi:arabinogalactan oligomer/maltooligosaccharide transport system permease protein